MCYLTKSYSLTTFLVKKFIVDHFFYRKDQGKFQSKTFVSGSSTISIYVCDTFKLAVCFLSSHERVWATPNGNTTTNYIYLHTKHVLTLFWFFQVLSYNGWIVALLMAKYKYEVFACGFVDSCVCVCVCSLLSQSSHENRERTFIRCGISCYSSFVGSCLCFCVDCYKTKIHDRQTRTSTGHCLSRVQSSLGFIVWLPGHLPWPFTRPSYEKWVTRQRFFLATINTHECQQHRFSVFFLSSFQDECFRWFITF